MNAPGGLGRSNAIRIRVTDKEREAFQRSADLAGLTLSSWVRMVTRVEAIAMLGRKDSGLVEERD